MQGCRRSAPAAMSMYDEASVAADGPAGTGAGAATIETAADGEIVVPDYDAGALPAGPGGAARTQGSGFGLRVPVQLYIAVPLRTALLVLVRNRVSPNAENTKSAFLLAISMTGSSRD